MTVPAAIKNAKKIEMIQQLDKKYRPDHAVTTTQKKIPRAFCMDVKIIKAGAKAISVALIEDTVCAKEI